MSYYENENEREDESKSENEGESENKRGNGNGNEIVEEKQNANEEGKYLTGQVYHRRGLHG
jgi:hypothetical protein